MNHLQKLFSPKSAPTKTVVITSNTSAGGRHLERGETVTLDAKTAAALIAAEVARDPNASNAAAERQKVLDTLIPPPVEPEAMPEHFKDLPKPFGAWWKLESEFRALLERKNQTFNRLIKKRSPWTLDADFGSIETNLAHGQKDLVINKVISGIYIGAVPDSVVAECEHLEDFYNRLEKAVDDWKSKNGERCLVLKIESGDALQALNEKLRTDIEDLHSTGFRIFSMRVEPLGLSEHKTRELFYGSADWHRYSSFVAPSMQGLRLAYFDHEANTGRSFVDLGIESIATHYRTNAKLAAEVQPLLKQAKTELARAQKTAA